MHSNVKSIPSFNFSVFGQARRQLEQTKIEEEEEEIRQFGQAKKVNCCCNID